MPLTLSAKSLLSDPERHPLDPPASAIALGSTVVFAPHPDDESLACGGLLALLAEAKIPAGVVVLTDGSRSHPHSQSYPAARLAAVREKETLQAADALGLRSDSVHFLRFRDCGLPAEGTNERGNAISLLRELLDALSPDTVLVPWRRDPHCDHEATWRLVRATFRELKSRPRWLEYPVWTWPQTESELAPREDEAAVWRLDIAPVLSRKTRAIAQHRSQLGGLIDDDASGFVLLPQMLVHFTRPWELFIEPYDV